MLCDGFGNTWNGVTERQTHRMVFVCHSNADEKKNWPGYSILVVPYPYESVLRIRDVYPDPGSDFFPSRIPDPNFFYPGSASKNLSILTPQKWFPNSRKYDPGCSFRVPDPDPDFLSIPDSGSRGRKGTGSRIRIRNTASNRSLFKLNN